VILLNLMRNWARGGKVGAVIQFDQTLSNFFMYAFSGDTR